MKSLRLQAVLSLLLVLVMMLSSVGCAATSNDSGTTAEKPASNSDGSDESGGRGTKIGILCSPLSWGEENYRMVEKYIEKYGEDRLIVNTMPEDADVQTIVSLASKMAGDPECGAIIMNEAAMGAIAAMKAVREINPEMLTFVINASEEPIEVASVSDFACMTAFPEFGTAIADAAHSKGLEVVVFEAPADQLGLTRVQERINACKVRCEELGITFIQTTLPNEGDPNTRPALVQAAKEDVYNKINEYGDKVGFFPHTSFVYVAQITAILDLKAGYIVGIPDTGPFSPAYCDAFGISAPAEHVMDVEWTNKAISDKVIELGMPGHFGNWEYPFISTFMGASIDYANDYLDGKIDKGDVDAWMQYYIDVFGMPSDEITYFPFNKDGTDYENFIMVNSKIRYYGEDLGV